MMLILLEASRLSQYQCVPTLGKFDVFEEAHAEQNLVGLQSHAFLFLNIALFAHLVDAVLLKPVVGQRPL